MNGRKRRKDKDVDLELSEAPDEVASGPFTKGAIIRILLKDFMTYKKVELHAGPYLNMVLGPNGTGKSALVCAIIVGLGGEPAVTGRSGTYYDYVRFGASYGYTEVELYNPNGENYVIRRKLTTLFDGKCKSEWELNNIPKKLSEIKELIASLNIRVSNLCQFLPQEKVVEFARMNAIELLENTQKAAGDENMFKYFEKLKFCSEKVKELKKKKTNLDQQLATEQTLTDRMIEQVERVREKEQYKEKIAWLQKKKPWLEFEEFRQDYIVARTNLEKRIKEFEKGKSQNKPMEEKVAREKKAHEKAVAETKSSLDELRSVLNVSQSHKKDYDKLTDKIGDVLAELEGKKRIEESRLAEIKKYTQEKKIIEERLAASPDEDFANQIAEIEAEAVEKNSSLKRLTLQRDRIVSELEKLRDKHRQLKQEREQIVNVEAKRRDLLRNTDAKVSEAADWLRRNREKFSRMIYEPIMTQINVKSAEWIIYVEAIIPRRDLIAFVCEDIEDLKKFTTVLKGQGLNVNVVQAPGLGDVDMDPKLSLENIASYGFKHYINELFEAPDPIIRYLCKNYNLHNVPVGDNNVDSTRFLRENSQIQRFYCGNTSHSWTVSRYDREKVISTDRLRDPTLLVKIVDHVRKRKIEETMEAIVQEGKAMDADKAALDEEIEALRRSLSSLRDKRKHLVEKRDEKKTLQIRLQQKIDQIERKTREKVDLAGEKVKTKVILESLIQKKMDKLELLGTALEKCVNINTKKLTSEVTANCTKARLQKAKDDLEKANLQFENYETDIERLKGIRDEKRRLAKQKQTEAQKAVDCEKIDLPQRIRDKFGSLPDTIIEIDEEMRRLFLRMSSMEDLCDDTVLSDYNQQNNLIKLRKREIDNVTADLKVMESDLDMYKGRWMPTIQELVSRIDTNFSKFMSRLEYAGEVSLSHGEDPDDFSSYGICIKVRYRDNETLKELSAFHQSGGERSVATMIYMIALQELTKVPFRIVDEINQGMDDTNERRVFDLIVEAASTNSSQYFLFSPKLLPKLTYTDRMHIHIIFNGPKFSVNWNQLKGSISTR